MDVAPTASGSVALGPHEARLLAGHLQRLLRWDSRAHVRVLLRPTAVGIYSAPPTGVLSFVALPRIGSAGDGLDVTVPISELLAHADPGGSGRFTLPLGVAGPPALAVLPPADGWQLPIHAISGDVVPLVDDAVAEFEQRAAASQDLDALAEQIWSRSSFGGLPMRVLHTARRLGFLTEDACRISAATRTGWKRLTTIRGQVFVRTEPAVPRPHLTVVR